MKNTNKKLKESYEEEVDKFLGKAANWLLLATVVAIVFIVSVNIIK